MVCDDGSTDGTAGILEEYARTQGLHYQVNPRNLGYIKNFEKTISLCSGDYIALCDQDDRWNPDKLKILTDEIGDHSLICSDAALIDGDGNKIAGSLRRYSRIHIPSRGRQVHSLIFNNFVMGCTSLFHRSDFISSLLYPFPDGIPHDRWIAVMASMRNGIKYLKKPLIEHRLHEKNIIGAKRNNLLNDIRTCNDKLKANLNHVDIAILVNDSLLLLNELENRALVDPWMIPLDPWMISLKGNLQALLLDYKFSYFTFKHPTANLIILQYLNYFCPSPNPFVKIMFIIENFQK